MSTGNPVSETPASPEPANPPQSLLERLADSTQQFIQVVVGSHRKPPRRFKSLLNGTWLGHPLHPVMIVVPIGSWLLTALLDLIWLASPASVVWAARGAEIIVGVGILGALGAVAAGLTDWSDADGAVHRIGFIHAIFNSSAVLLYIVSFVLRLTQPAGNSVPGAILGFIGAGCIIYAATLGGEMVFVKGQGVNHTAWESGSEDYEAVLPVESVAENKLYRVMASGVPVVLLRQGLQFYALSATCPHAGGPLDEGELQGDVVQCPWHGSRFRLRDGRVLTGPATSRAARYEVRVSHGQVELKRVSEH